MSAVKADIHDKKRNNREVNNTEEEIYRDFIILSNFGRFACVTASKREFLPSTCDCDSYVALWTDTRM